MEVRLVATFLAPIVGPLKVKFVVSLNHCFGAICSMRLLICLYMTRPLLWFGFGCNWGRTALVIVAGEIIVDGSPDYLGDRAILGDAFQRGPLIFSDMDVSGAHDP